MEKSILISDELFFGCKKATAPLSSMQLKEKVMSISIPFMINDMRDVDTLCENLSVASKQNNKSGIKATVLRSLFASAVIGRPNVAALRSHIEGQPETPDNALLISYKEESAEEYLGRAIGLVEGIFEQVSYADGCAENIANIADNMLSLQNERTAQAMKLLKQFGFKDIAQDVESVLVQGAALKQLNSM
jgi:hypothetical protein